MRSERPDASLHAQEAPRMSIVDVNDRLDAGEDRVFALVQGVASCQPPLLAGPITKTPCCYYEYSLRVRAPRWPTRPANTALTPSRVQLAHRYSLPTQRRLIPVSVVDDTGAVALTVDPRRHAFPTVKVRRRGCSGCSEAAAAATGPRAGSTAGAARLCSRGATSCWQWSVLSGRRECCSPMTCVGRRVGWGGGWVGGLADPMPGDVC